MSFSVPQLLGLVLVAIAVLVWTLLPLFHMIVLSLTPINAAFAGRLWPDAPTIANYGIIFRQENHYLGHFWRQLWNSVFAAGMSCLVVLVVATMASYAIGRLKLWFGPLVTNLSLITYLIPAAFLAIPFYQVMAAYNLLDSLWGLVFAVVTFTTPYAIWVLRNYADSVPYELDEAAMVDGATPWQSHSLALSMRAASRKSLGTPSKNCL